jgi:hypothetical protein
MKALFYLDTDNYLILILFYIFSIGYQYLIAYQTGLARVLPLWWL